MAINVYINFNGNCSEAVDFYAEAFKVDQQQRMTFGEAPENPEFKISEEAKNLIMHTFLMINGTKIMFSDVFPGMRYVQGNNISLSVVYKDKEDVITTFNKLKVGGKIGMDLQETFWSKCYGSVTDKFGIEWQISLES